MPLRVRDLCRQTLDFAIQARLLPAFERSGRFVEPAGLRSAHAYNVDIKRIAHYATARGPLYGSERSWERAYRLVQGFTRERRTLAHRRLPRLLGPFPELEPATVLAQIEAALLRLGFTTIDRNNASFSAAFTAEDSCRVEDLPEPYGKWLQIKRQRQRWTEKVELLIDLGCRVETEDTATGYDTFVGCRLSVPVPSLLLALDVELRDALLLPSPGPAAEAALRATATAALREFLG